MSTGRTLRRLPVVPGPEPVQLVLALDGVGIVKARRRRRHRKPHPWMPAPREAAA